LKQWGSTHPAKLGGEPQRSASRAFLLAGKREDVLKMPKGHSKAAGSTFATEPKMQKQPARYEAGWGDLGVMTQTLYFDTDGNSTSTPMLT